VRERGKKDNENPREEEEEDDDDEQEKGRRRWCSSSSSSSRSYTLGCSKGSRGMITIYYEFRSWPLSLSRLHAVLLFEGAAFFRAPSRKHTRIPSPFDGFIQSTRFSAASSSLVLFFFLSLAVKYFNFSFERGRSEEPSESNETKRNSDEYISPPFRRMILNAG